MDTQIVDIRESNEYTLENILNTVGNFAIPGGSMASDIAQIGIFLKANDNRFNNANIMQSICSQEMMRVIFDYDQKDYDAQFNSSRKRRDIVDDMPEPNNQLPFPPAHFSGFMCIPTKPSTQADKTQGSWKECSFCGSQSSLTHQGKLRNHIPKNCPFLHASNTSRQGIYTKRYMINCATLVDPVKTVLSMFKSNVDSLERVYQVARPLIASRYSNFFIQIGRDVPRHFSDVFICQDGTPYDHRNLPRGIQMLIDEARVH